MTARAERQAYTRSLLKCACGNVATAGTPQCGRCAQIGSERDELDEALQDVRRAADGDPWRSAVESLLEMLVERTKP